ncbi:MAG: UDP-N-acetylmuramate dehydrogenase [Lachnospiraceae bacterium]|nr:UDP-N-acetylmuramate dehydrogenase [Lachnospiraceae bacterium]
MDIREQLINACGADYVSFDEPMSKHTTFRVGGNADYYIRVSSLDQFVNGIRLLKDNDISITILGNGSNVLVSDKGIRGAVFELGKDFSDVSINRLEDNIEVKAEAGALLSNVGATLLKEGIKGFHWASGIPGSVGGAVYMNAGAYGGEIKDILKEATVLTKDLNVEVRDLDSLDLSYRHSALMSEEAYVLSATFVLEEGDSKEIKALTDELNKKRRDKQPLEYPSAGSTFKRPEGYFAGKLIEDSGLKGFRVGGASVSSKHCGFVVNDQNATAADIYNLTEEVIKIVKDKFGVTLEREIRLIGEF